MMNCRLENIEEYAQSYFSTGQIHASDEVCDVCHYVEVLCCEKRKLKSWLMEFYFFLSFFSCKCISDVVIVVVSSLWTNISQQQIKEDKCEGGGCVRGCGCVWGCVCVSDDWSMWSSPGGGWKQSHLIKYTLCYGSKIWWRKFGAMLLLCIFLS